VLSARTLREIARLICDLPGGHFSGQAKAAGRRGAPRRWVVPGPAAPPVSRSRPAAESRWSLLQSLVAPAGCP
jgi:hypothetical protein